MSIFPLTNHLISELMLSLRCMKFAKLLLVHAFSIKMLPSRFLDQTLWQITYMFALTCIKSKWVLQIVMDQFWQLSCFGIDWTFETWIMWLDFTQLMRWGCQLNLATWQTGPQEWVEISIIPNNKLFFTFDFLR